MALTYQLIVLLGLSSGLWMGADAADCKSGCCLICPGGWERYNGRCYEFVNQLKDWSEAEDECIARGGNLASIHSAADLEYFRGLARPDGEPTRTWVGGNDIIKEGSWKFADGTDFPASLPGWGPPPAAEPNDPAQGPEDCMEIMAVNEAGDEQPLNDAPCNVKKAFICCRDPRAVSRT